MHKEFSVDITKNNLNMGIIDERTKDIANVFSKWLTEREVKLQTDKYDIVKDYIDNDKKRLKAMENLFIAPGEEIRKNLLTFFSQIYDEDKKVIDWEKNPSDSSKSNILESFLGGVGYGKEKLVDRIDNFFHNMTADGSEGCKGYINFAREERNKLHPEGKYRSKDDHIREYKIQIISLFVLSIVCLLNDVSN